MGSLNVHQQNSGHVFKSMQRPVHMFERKQKKFHNCDLANERGRLNANVLLFGYWAVCIGLIAALSSTCHINIWCTLSRGQVDDGWPNRLPLTIINHFLDWIKLGGHCGHHATRQSPRYEVTLPTLDWVHVDKASWCKSGWQVEFIFRVQPAMQPEVAVEIWVEQQIWVAISTGH